jgi:uncharacterized protein YgiM (DUF1202 family)
MARVVRTVAPWIVLVAVIWVIYGSVADFARSGSDSASAGQGSGASSSTTSSGQASVVTTVTGMIATTRVRVILRSQPSTATAAVATSQQGSDLEVLAKQGTWFRVKDSSGHTGWIPNDSTYVSVRKK